MWYTVDFASAVESISHAMQIKSDFPMMSRDMV